MNILQELIQIDEKANKPKYLQITNAFIQNIRSGKLRRGLKLPGSREVASILGINRMTMVAAYDELQAQGWIEMIPRKGTYIREELPILGPKVIQGKGEIFSMPPETSFSIDKDRVFVIPYSDVPNSARLAINDGFPDPRLAPIGNLTREMRRISKLGSYRKYLMYGGAQGNKHLRETLASFLSETRGLPIGPNNILVTRGATMGIFLTASLLTVPGDQIIVGEPGYMGANEIFQQLRLDLNKVPVDEEGIDTDGIEGICKKKKIKFVYVIPHHHHPTTVTLPPKRRAHLLELALKYGFAIIEDDYDYDFHYASQPLMPMASLDQHGSVVYIGTLTKTLAPSIRIGFMVAPENFIKNATYIRKAVDTQGDSLLELAIAELYNDGTITRHIKKSVKCYKERRDNFCGLLRHELGDHVTFREPDGGMSVWGRFNDGIDLKGLSECAGKKGLSIKDGTEFDTSKKQYNAIRMGFACLNLEEQEEAIAIIKSCIA